MSAKSTNSNPYAHTSARHSGRPDRHRKRSPATQAHAKARVTRPSWPTTKVAMLARPPFSWFSAWVMAIVAHPCRACHHRSGTANATAIAAPPRNQRFQTIRRPPLSRAPMTRATAKKLML